MVCKRHLIEVLIRCSTRHRAKYHDRLFVTCYVQPASRHPKTTALAGNGGERPDEVPAETNPFANRGLIAPMIDLIVVGQIGRFAMPRCY